MLKKSDIVICYATHRFGGAGNMVAKAIRQKNKVINLVNEIDDSYERNRQLLLDWIDAFTKSQEDALK